MGNLASLVHQVDRNVCSSEEKPELSSLASVNIKVGGSGQVLCCKGIGCLKQILRKNEEMDKGIGGLTGTLGRWVKCGTLC